MLKPIESVISDMKDSYAGIGISDQAPTTSTEKRCYISKIAAVAPFEENRRVQLQVDVIKRRMNEMLNNAYHDLANMRYLLRFIIGTEHASTNALKTAIDMANVDF